MGITQRRKQSFSAFHHAIIALLLGIFIAGCGYKTAPVYQAPADNNQTVISR